MPPQISIGGRRVGPAHAPLVVAEIGINHEGSLEVAIEMVDAAARAGVEVVKHQTHVVEDEMSGAAQTGRARQRRRVDLRDHGSAARSPKTTSGGCRITSKRRG